MSVMCAPLLGDRMYGPMAGLLVDSLDGVADDLVVEAVRQTEQVEGPVGLHAASLAWGQVEVLAPPPWE